MKMTHIHTLLIVTYFLLPGCSNNNEIHKDNITVLGKAVDITIIGVPAEKAQAAISEVEQVFNQFDQIGYTFQSTGELRQLNKALAKNRTYEISADFAGLLQTADSLSRSSDGLFNPAAGALTAMWEFQCDTEDCEQTHYSEDVRQLINQHVKYVINQQPAMNDLIYKGNTISSRNPAVKLEFGDIIRGYAIDSGMQRLKELDIENARINLKGSSMTTGSRGDHPWWFGIPVVDEENVIGFIEAVNDEAVVTVHAFDKSTSRGETIYRHVVDPRNGLPVKDIRSVTVIHDSATVANVAATVFLINGISDWSTLAKKMDVQAVLIIAADETIYLSPHIEERLHWKQDIPHQHLIPNK